MQQPCAARSARLGAAPEHRIRQLAELYADRRQQLVVIQAVEASLQLASQPASQSAGTSRMATRLRLGDNAPPTAAASGERCDQQQPANSDILHEGEHHQLVITKT